jgi:hypothetical protein
LVNYFLGQFAQIWLAISGSFILSPTTLVFLTHKRLYPFSLFLLTNFQLYISVTLLMLQVILQGVNSMCSRTPEQQAAMDRFDEQIKKHGSLEKWLDHRKTTEPGFVVEEEFIPFEEIPKRLAELAKSK